MTVVGIRAPRIVPLTLALLERVTAACEPPAVAGIAATRDDGDVTAWMRERIAAPGIKFAMLAGGVPVAAGGVVATGLRDVGEVWLLPGAGWRPHVKTVLTAWRAILREGGYRRLECNCFASNLTAQRFAHRAGFELEGRRRAILPSGEDVLYYGIVLTNRADRERPAQAEGSGVTA